MNQLELKQAALFPQSYILLWNRCHDGDKLKLTGYSSITYVRGSSIKEGIQESKTVLLNQRA